MRVHVARNLFDRELCVSREGQLWQQFSNLRAKDFAGAGVGNKLDPTATLV